MKAYKTKRSLSLKRRMKAATGKALAAINPALAAQVAEKPFSHPWKPHERLIRNALQEKAIAGKVHETLNHFIIDYWASPFSEEFFKSFAHRFEDLFLCYHQEVVTQLKGQLANVPESEEVHLVEVGCGDGLVLQHLAEKLPRLTQLTGIDISEEEIARCQKRHADASKLTFTSQDIFEWLAENQKTHLVLFANGGVLEYFTRTQLKTLFKQLKNPARKS